MSEGTLEVQYSPGQLKVCLREVWISYLIYFSYPILFISEWRLATQSSIIWSLFYWFGSKGNHLRGVVVVGDVLLGWLDCCKCLHYSQADENLQRFPKSSQPSDLTGISSLVSDEVFWARKSWNLKRIVAFRRLFHFLSKAQWIVRWPLPSTWKLQSF